MFGVEGDIILDIVEQIEERLSFFKNIYDFVRIVDPVENKAMVIKDNDKEITEGFCYDFWKKDAKCENCISIRAYLENDTFVKMEYVDGKAFLITAVPVEFNGKLYIAEILKDISTNGTIVNTNDKKVADLIDELNDKVIKDDLTKIYNRRYINEKLPVDISKSLFENKPLSIIMCDIDYFKNINDKYGHVIGDKVLHDFAQLISKNIRKETDWVGRYGGEEFLIVLNNSISKNAYNVAEKIRKLLEKTTLSYDSISFNITASFGVKENTDSNKDAEELIKMADSNLYRAKSEGRNRTVV